MVVVVLVVPFEVMVTMTSYYLLSHEENRPLLDAAGLIALLVLMALWLLERKLEVVAKPCLHIENKDKILYE